MAEITAGVQVTIKGPRNELVTFGGPNPGDLEKYGTEALGEDGLKVLMAGVVDHVLSGGLGSGTPSPNWSQPVPREHARDNTSQAVANLQQGGLLPQPGLSSQAPPDYPQQQAAPAVAAPSCAHGARTRRTGTSARGPWTGWFCPLPKGDPAQCKAQFEK